MIDFAAKIDYTRNEQGPHRQRGLACVIMDAGIAALLQGGAIPAGYQKQQAPDGGFLCIVCTEGSRAYLLVTTLKGVDVRNDKII